MMPDIVNARPPATGGCTAATNYLARTTGGNEGGNAANITTLICGLVTDGVITGNLSGATRLRLPSSMSMMDRRAAECR